LAHPESGARRPDRLAARLVALAVACGSGQGGCARAPRLAELDEAERLARAGHEEAALEAYLAAQLACRRLHDRLRRVAACADARLGRADLLVGLGRRAEAARDFEAAALALAAEDDAGAAHALARAGSLRLEAGQDERAYQLLWRAVIDYPDQVFAADALESLVRDGRRRAPSQLYQVLRQLEAHGVTPRDTVSRSGGDRSGGEARIGDTELGDDLLLAMAELAGRELADPRAALAHYDELVAAHPRSGLCDDALWRAAELARRLGDGPGAIRRLRALIATREEAWFIGSYFSVWLDDAQLELGRILRDDLGQPRAAADTFSQLLRDNPASTLRDDALWERARTLAGLGERDEACRALGQLRGEHAESRWELEAAPALRRRLFCRGREADLDRDRARPAKRPLARAGAPTTHSR
jgi:tetratricopeptide (TPR) repeat protein